MRQEVAVDRLVAASTSDVRATAALTRVAVTVVVESSSDVAVARLAPIRLARAKTPELRLQYNRTSIEYRGLMNSM